MERQAMLVYLQNVRDLEVAMYRISQIGGEELRAYKSMEHQLTATNYQPLPKKPTENVSGVRTFLSLFFLLGAMTSIVALVTVLNESHSFPTWVWAPLLAGIIIFPFDSYICSNAHRHRIDMRTYHRQLLATKQHNEAEQARERQNLTALQRERAQWNRKDQYLKQELKTVDALLQEAYQLNLIPSQFRSLAHVCYIYRSMRTSQLTLTDVLYHTPIEDEVQQILKQLDTIISKNDQLIFNQRFMEAQNQKSLTDKINLLATLQHAEANPLAAAYYTKISSNYTKTTAYFSLANYLKR